MTFDEADRLYPYDPGADVKRLHGVEKLRAFDDPGMRRIVWEIHGNTWTGRGYQERTARPDPRLAPASRAFLDTEDDSDTRFP